MEKCPHCNKSVTKDSQFCNHCSQKLEWPTDGKEPVAPASQGWRLINYFIDYSIGASVISSLLGFTLSVLGFLSGNEGPNTFYLLAFVSICLYFYGCEKYLHGKTLGKFLTGTRAVMADGSELTTEAIVKRTLFRFVPFEIFSFTGNHPVGWHDRWSKTRVIKG